MGDAPPTSFIGQLVGVIVMLLCGFIPGFVISLALKSIGILRVPDKVQEIGLDLAEIPSKAYPEAVGSKSAALMPAE